MRHSLDLTSLIWGVILTITAGLLAASRWSDVELSGARVVPVVLVGLGVLILGATFLRGAGAEPLAEPDSGTESPITG